MLPIKQLLFTFPPALAIQITSLAVVILAPAEMPSAVLESPLVLKRSAALPIAVLLPSGGVVKGPQRLYPYWSRRWCCSRAPPAPVAVLLSAVLARSVPAPMAVLRLPVRLL
jgi:hypothetical protein